MRKNEARIFLKEGVRQQCSDDEDLYERVDRRAGGILAEKGRIVPTLPTACDMAYSKGTISNATMLMILMSGLIAGPAVSL